MADREIYAGRIVTLRLRDLPGPDGAVRVREIVEHAPAAAVVAVDDQGQVLLVRQFRPAVDKVLLELPAGILDPGEDPLTCARRELEEETGYTADRFEPLVRFYPSPGFCTELLHVFVADGLRECRGQPDEDEELELVRMPLAEAIDQVRHGHITDSKTVVGLLFLTLRHGATWQRGTPLSRRTTPPHAEGLKKAEGRKLRECRSAARPSAGPAGRDCLLAEGVPGRTQPRGGCRRRWP